MRNFARLLLRRIRQRRWPLDVSGRSRGRNHVAQGIGFGLILLAASSNFAQEHATSPAQCQTDERLWSNESKLATSGTGFDVTIKRYPLNELIARAREMSSCMVTDTRNGSSYSSASMLILSQVERRLTRYIQETGQAEKYDAWERQQSAQ